MNSSRRLTPLKEPITDEWLNKEQIAWFFNVSTEALRKWDKATPPIPCIGENRYRRYNLFDVIDWHREYKQAYKTTSEKKEAKKVAVAESDYLNGIPPIDVSEAELTYWKSQKAKHDLSVARKETVKVEHVLSLISTQISKTRTDILSIPARLRGEFGPDVYLRCNDLINQTLSNMAHNLTNLDLTQIFNDDVIDENPDEVIDKKIVKQRKSKKTLADKNA